MASERTRRLQREGQRQLKLKLKLERKLDRKMRSFFREQNRRFLKADQELNMRLDAEALRPELEAVLNGHYWDTAAKFHPRIVAEINEVLEEADKAQVSKDDPELAAALLFFIAAAVRQSARAITRTSNKEFGKALDDAKGDSKEAYKKLQKRNIPRAKTIAATETQKAAEGSKQVAAEEMGNIASGMLAASVVLSTTKTWVTRQDAKVRSDHAAAEGQTVPIKDPFLVGGEFMMFPGDGSLGASMWNLANCRCNSIQETSII